MRVFDSLRIISLLLGFAACLLVGGGKANADFIFGTATNLGPPVNGPYRDTRPHISVDGLSLYFSSDRAGGLGGLDIWVATRATIDDAWRTPVNLGPPVNSSYHEVEPCASADGLELYFHSLRPAGCGDADIWVATRATPNDRWASPVNLGPPVNSPYAEWDPCISADGLSLYFSSTRRSHPVADLCVATRPSTDAQWGEPLNLGPVVNSSAIDGDPSIWADGLVLLFTSNRDGGIGGWDLWVTTRPTKNDGWGTPVNLGPEVNSVFGESSPTFSPDGILLYFCDYPEPRPGGYGSQDIW